MIPTVGLTSRVHRLAIAALWSFVLVPGLGLILLLAADAKTLHAQATGAPSPCRLDVRLDLSNKLACPLDTVTLTLSIQASCPMEADGRRSEVVGVELENPLAANLRGSSGTLGGEGESEGIHSLGPVPGEGLQWQLRLLALRSGVYPVGQDMRLRLRDDRGRSAEASVRDSIDLVVNPCGYGGEDRLRQVFLPLAQHPRCQVSQEAADIVLAIDRSTSMGRTGVAMTLSQARSFIESVNLERDRVALLAFDREPQLISGLTQDRALLLAALQGVGPGRLTAIDRAIEAGMGILGAGGDGRRRVLALVSDGHQTGLGDEAAVRAAALRARRSGIRILTLAVDGEDVDPNWKLLRDLTENASRSIRLNSGADEASLSRAYRELAELSGCLD